MKKFLLALALIAFYAYSPAKAEDAVQQQSSKFTFDKNHTQIFFSVSHLGFSHSTGKFLDFDGGFVFDEKAPDASSVDVTIKTASIELDDQKWNDHLKGADFFNVEKFPDMTFKSTKVELNGEKAANVTGDLTLLGVTKPVTLAVTFNQCGTHPYSGKSVCGFSITGTLKRSEFGMTYGVPGVGDDVALRIEVEGEREAPPVNQ